MTDSKENKNLKDKLSDTLESINAEEKLEGLYQYSRTHVGDTISYVTLFVGIILTLFQNTYGLAMIGVIAGLYHSVEIIAFAKGISEYVEKNGTFYSFILGATVLGLFIAAPMFFIGTAAAIGLKMVIVGVEKNEDKAHEDNNEKE